jgi:hypothetical protein
MGVNPLNYKKTGMITPVIKAYGDSLKPTRGKISFQKDKRLDVRKETSLFNSKKYYKTI